LSAGTALIWLLGVARGGHLAAYFCAFGALSAEAFFVRLGVLRRLAWGAFGLAAFAGGAWFVGETINFSGAADWADLSAALPVVLTQTRFGYVLAGRLGVLLGALALAELGARRAGAWLALLGCVAESWLGHGGAMLGSAEGDVLFGCALAHVGAAALWMGMLPALLLVMAKAPEAELAPVMRRFSKLGMGCVVAILATALVQVWLLVGRVGALVSSVYGRLALAKFVLLLALLGLAWVHKFRLTPALPASRARFLRSLAVETGVGLLVLLLAGFLLQFQPPAMAAMAGG
jgi:putative copper resistance protein D